MGASRYSDHVYTARMVDHSTKGTDPFSHDHDIKSGRVKSAVHESLDPSKVNKAGNNIRESVDSDVHPDSVAVAVIWDVTGSMSLVPRIFLEKMPKLMAALVKKGYLAHPHVLFGAVGDATCDKVPLQIGQFEGGNEMDAAITNIVLESGGGGHITESYELAMYYMARHTAIDCHSKRGKKGYLFFLGDELPYDKISRKQVKALIGDDLEADIPTSEILTELREKFEVFWVMPAGTSHTNNPDVCDPLKKMFGQHFLRLDDASDVCELVVGTIGLMEGYDLDGIRDDLKDIGSDAGAISRATSALVPFASKAVTKAAVASGALVVAGDDGVTRL